MDMDEKVKDWINELGRNYAEIHDRMPVKGNLNASIRVYAAAGRHREAAELCISSGLEEMSLSYLRKAGMYTEGAEIAEANGCGSAEHFRKAASMKPDEAKAYMDGIYVQPTTVAQWMMSG